ncbi:MAG: phosphate/phosphite/phosphonate ABC transporter substrate-binding protein [Gammaproteobacteria bacterium]
MNCKILILIAILLGCLLPAAGQAADTEAMAKPPPLSFGIVPQQTSSTLLRAWGPLLRYLQEQTGQRFIFRTAPDIPTFEARLAAGEYDFAYMNPYHFTVFNQGDQGYQAVARARDKQIRGILVVRKDSPATMIEDLKNATLAFPSPAAFAASVLPRANLRAKQVPFEVQYVSSHDSVYKAVAGGFFPAGGGIIRTFKATDPKVREQLRVLWTTPPYTPHAIAAHPRVDAAVVSSVQQALVLMDVNEKGRIALENLKIKGLAAAKNSDWDDVRSLQIGTSLGTAR